MKNTFKEKGKIEIIVNESTNEQQVSFKVHGKLSHFETLGLLRLYEQQTSINCLRLNKQPQEDKPIK